MNEMTVTFKIEAPGLIAAIEKLAAAMLGGAPGHTERTLEPARATPIAAPVAPVAASATPVATPDVPIAASAVLPTAPIEVPTTPASGYSVEQLGRAGADLLAADPAKRDGLLALLQQFGVPAINLLRAEQYGAFATALRGLGANI